MAVESQREMFDTEGWIKRDIVAVAALNVEGGKRVDSSQPSGYIYPRVKTATAQVK